jgi:hypothetical protein
MAVVEHTLTNFLRNSGSVLSDVEQWDVIVKRRDGPDLYISLDTRESLVRDVLGLLARLLVVASSDPKTLKRLSDELPALLPWSSFLPADERRQLVADLVAKAAGCADLDMMEPLSRLLDGWRASAEIYANPDLLARIQSPSDGPAVPITRPRIP